MCNAQIPGGLQTVFSLASQNDGPSIELASQRRKDIRVASSNSSRWWTAAHFLFTGDTRNVGGPTYVLGMPSAEQRVSLRVSHSSSFPASASCPSRLLSHSLSQTCTSCTRQDEARSQNGPCGFGRTPQCLCSATGTAVNAFSTAILWKPALQHMKLSSSPSEQRELFFRVWAVPDPEQNGMALRSQLHGCPRVQI